jgi:hypothetical protein
VDDVVNADVRLAELLVGREDEWAEGRVDDAADAVADEADDTTTDADDEVGFADSSAHI